MIYYDFLLYLHGDRIELINRKNVEVYQINRLHDMITLNLNEIRDEYPSQREQAGLYNSSISFPS